MTDISKKLIEERKGILATISDWIKLLAYFVSAAELIIVIFMILTPKTNPWVNWYPLFMLFFLVILAFGIIWDRHKERQVTPQQKISIGELEMSIDTSPALMKTEQLKTIDVQNYYIDQNIGYVLPKPPKEPIWSDLQNLTLDEILVKQGILHNLEDFDELKTMMNVQPLGNMFSNVKILCIQYGDDIDIQFTEKSSSKIVDDIIGEIINIAEEEGVDIEEEEINEIRKTIMLKDLPDKFRILNGLTIHIYDKSLAVHSALEPTLGNVFLIQANIFQINIQDLVANKNSIAWGNTWRFTNVLINNEIRECVSYRVNRMIENERYIFQIGIILSSPYLESDIDAWEKLKNLFYEFQLIRQ